MATVRNEIMEVVRNFPGATLEQTIELMPHANAGGVKRELRLLYQSGALVRRTIPNRRGSGRLAYAYEVNPDPAQKPPTPEKRRMKYPTDNALIARIAELDAQIVELVQWKREAIERYPDLAVDPIVIEARKIVAKELREGGDGHMADDVLAGKKDASLPMRATVAALSR